MGTEYASYQTNLIAAGNFSGATPPVILSNYGYVSPAVRNAKGDFTVTLANPCDVANRAVVCQASSPNTAHYDPGGSTDSTIHFLVVDAAGAAVDADVDFVCMRTRVGV